MTEDAAPPQRRPWYARRRILFSGVLLAAFVAAVVFAGAAMLRGPLEGVLSSELGRDVSINGVMTLGWSGGPTLIASDVSIAGNTVEEPAVEAGRVDVGLAVDPLLRGEIVVTHAHFSDVLIRLDQMDRGAPQEDAADILADPISPPTAADLAIVSGDLDITLENVTVESGTGDQLVIDALELTSNARDGLAAQGSLELGGRSFTLTLTGGRPGDLAGDQAFPIDLVISDGETRLEAHGSVVDALSDLNAVFTLDGQGRDLDGLLSAFDVATGFEDNFDFHAGLSLDDGLVRVSDLSVDAGGFSAQGDLAVNLVTQPMAISGDLKLSVLPARTTSDDDAPGEPEFDLGALLDRTVPYHLLETLDLDLKLALGHHDLGPFAMDDIVLPIVLQEGHLAISPIDVTLDGQAFEAHVEVDLEGQAVAVRVLGDNMPLSELLIRLRPDLGLKGDANGLVFKADAQGQDLRSLLSSLKLDLSLASFFVENTYDDGTLVVFEVDALKATAGTGEGLRLSANGRLDNETAAISLAGGRLRDLFDNENHWPIELHIGNSQRGIELAGVLTRPDDLKGLHMEGLVNASDVQHVAELLDINLPFQGDVQAYLHVSDLEDGVRFDWIDLEVGNSSLNGTLDVTYADDLVGITGSLTAPNLKIDTGEGEENFDAPLLEHGDLDGVYADIALDIQRIKVATVRLRFIDAHLNIKDGVLRIDDADATVFETVAEVHVQVDAFSNPPVLSFKVATGEVNPSHVGNDLGMEGFMTGHIGNIEVSARAQGVTLRDLSDDADVTLLIEDGALSIGEGATSLEFVSLNLTAKPGQPASGSESVVLAGIPIDLDLEFVTLTDLFIEPSPWTLTASGALLGLNFSIAREITPALQVYALPVTMHMESDDLRTALAEFEIDLPQALPLRTRGTLQMLDDRIAFDLEETQLANTDLRGKLEVWIEGEPPRVQADFDSTLFTVDDFVEAEPVSEITDFDIVTFLADPLPAWEMPDVDLKVTLDAQTIHWDGTDMTEASLQITTSNDAIHLDDLSVRVFNGKVLGSLSLQPVGDATHAIASLDVEEIDADDVFRLTGIAEEAAGELELLLKVDTSGTSTGGMLGALDGSMLLKRGEGWIKSGAIEILNEDLFTALLSPAGRIPVRCTVVDLAFQAGQGTFGESFVALQNVVLGIVGSLNLDAMTINAEVITKSLDGTFMRLLTPVRVNGDLLDPDIGPRTGDLISGLGAALFGAGPTYDGDINAKCAAAAG